MGSTVGEFFKKNAVFTTRELADACGDGQTVRNLLHLAKASGRVRQVKRGLYVSNMGRFEDSRPPFQLVASKLASDAVLCHASAFSLFLGNQDVITEAPVYTRSHMRAFEFDGVRYVAYRPPAASLETRRYRIANGYQVVGTTREQTVVDSLSRTSRSGGVESVLRRLSALRYLDCPKAVSIARGDGPSTCARLGWVLERKQAEWDVADDLLAVLSRSIGRGPYYFGTSSGRADFDERWRLYLPEREDVMEGWLNG